MSEPMSQPTSEPLSGPLSGPLSVRRVLGAGPFAEIGEPTVAVRCEASGLAGWLAGRRS
ncbi:hypothetical protein GCM10009760_48220 [Kitasatospora kazusensis]|uniref:Uncharacterized protein n=1 Tax=Kitasatospora kazusensis TaxID=407974 RepID=A0ABN3A2T1_9ACTN